MTETSSEAQTKRSRDVAGLRRTSDFLCLWRLCANASCRRARSCHGRAHLCAARNGGALPEGVRSFLVSFLAARYAGLSFDEFRDEMEECDETEAYFAWRSACDANFNLILRRRGTRRLEG